MHSQSLTALVAISAAIGGLASPVAAPAKSTNSSSGEAHLQKRFTGSKWSFYDVGLGACGHTNNENEFVVALNAEQYGSGYPGPHCGESITLRYNGKSATAKIVDRCPGCPYGGLDLSRSLFRHFASEDLGIIYGEWDFGAAGGSGGAAPTSTKAETNSPKPSASTTQQQTTASPAPSAAASSSAPVSEVKTSSSAPQNTWSTSKAAPSSSAAPSAAQSKAPAPSSAAPAPQNTWSTSKAASSSAAAPYAQSKAPTPSPAASAPSKPVSQGGNDEEECEEDDGEDKKTTSPGSTHKAADSKPTQTSAVSSQSAAKKTDTPAPTGVNLKVAPSSTQAKPPSTSSSALPSAASAASALPTSDSSDAETVKKNLVLVGEILNSLGDYFDKVFKKESSGRSANTTVTLRRDD